MKEIKEVVKRIRCELRAAEWYAEEAVKDEAMYPTLAAHYRRMAEDNLSRVEDLHTAVVEMIDEVKRSGRQIPQGMLDVWEFEHELMVEQADDARAVLAKHHG